jgi:hypothetical protein
MPIDKIFTGWEKSKAQTLLKEASARKQAGDTKGAISLLKEAYAEIAKSGKIWNVSPFLRLPMYLQKLGREDEAWQELNLIISKGYPGQPKDKNVLMIEHSIVYDKMRLFLQRSGKNEKAVKYGILAYVTLAYALHKQGRMAELEVYISQNKPEAIVQKLLKKAEREDLLKQMCDMVKAELDYMSDFKVERLAEKIDRVIVTGII